MSSLISGGYSDGAPPLPILALDPDIERKARRNALLLVSTPIYLDDPS